MSGIDYNTLLAIKKQTFIAEIQVGAGAGLYSAAMLWNPAASGVLLRVKTILLTGSPMSTLASASATLPTVNVSGGNKYLGGAASKATGYSDQNAALSHGALVYLATINPGADTFEVPFAGPIIVPPAMGLGLWGQTQNAALNVTFEWDEVAG